jgi:hypothetical protein
MVVVVVVGGGVRGAAASGELADRAAITGYQRTPPLGVKPVGNAPQPPRRSPKPKPSLVSMEQPSTPLSSRASVPKAEQPLRPPWGRTPTGLSNRARLGNNGLKPPQAWAQPACWPGPGPGWMQILH